MQALQVEDATLEYEVRGAGEPVLLIHLSVVGDGLALPLFGQPELSERYQLVHYHRRGYSGSSLGSVPLTAERQAADAAAVLRHLGIPRAHVAGHSFGGTVALQLAVQEPELVHSLALLEPFLPLPPSARGPMRDVFGPTLSAYQAGDKRQALDSLSDAIFGPGWQAAVEQTVPGGLDQALTDFDTFVLEQGPLRAWQFGPAQAAAMRQPVLSVVGRHTSPFMMAGRAALHGWFPQVEDCDIESTHLLQMYDPQAVATALAGFFARHPMM